MPRNGACNEMASCYFSVALPFNLSDRTLIAHVTGTTRADRAAVVVIGAETALSFASTVRYSVHCSHEGQWYLSSQLRDATLPTVRD